MICITKPRKLYHYQQQKTSSISITTNLMWKALELRKSDVWNSKWYLMATTSDVSTNTDIVATLVAEVLFSIPTNDIF